MFNKVEIEGALVDWNFWGNFDIDYIKREIDLSKFFVNEMVLVLYGIRRSGKSFIAYGYLKELIKKGLDEKETLILNFEDLRLSNLKINEVKKVFDIYLSLTNAKKPIVVLDEIQNIKNWELFVRYLVENKKLKVIVTGSSSKLLGKEISSSLSGRKISKEIFPLSFRELLRFKGINIKNNLDILKNKKSIVYCLNESLNFGFFPKVVLEEDKNKKTEILRNYLEDIIVKDVVLRYNIKKEKVLKDLVNYFVNNISNLINLRKISRIFNENFSLIQRYSFYLENTRFLFFLNKFSFKEKDKIRSLKKIYLNDIGFFNLLGKRYEENKKLENLVFSELLKRNHDEIYYYKTKNGKEIDFLVKERNKLELIEVCYEFDEEHKKKLIKAMKELNLKESLCISWDEEDEIEEKGFRIKLVPLWKWLLK